MEEAMTLEAGAKEKGEDFHDWYLALFRKLLPDQEMSCRYCHGEDHSTAIYEKGITSCYQCHNYTKALIKGKPGKPKNIHETLTNFIENRCTTCHNPHSSPFPHLLKEAPESYQGKPPLRKDGND
jgi:formate-dependent nitrite reductase cytochrome c552 subunit